MNLGDDMFFKPAHCCAAAQDSALAAEVPKGKTKDDAHLGVIFEIAPVKQNDGVARNHDL